MESLKILVENMGCFPPAFSQLSEDLYYSSHKQHY